MGMFPEPLVKAALESENLSVERVWQLLPIEERVRTLSLAITKGEPAWGRQYLVEELSRRLAGFRRGTIGSWDDKKLASAAVKQRLDRPALARAAILALHFPDRRELQIHFFDSLQLQHRNGELESDGLPEPASDPASIARAATALLAAHPTADALFYLLAAVAMAPASWVGLGPWLRDFAASLGGDPAVESVPRADAIVGAPTGAIEPDPSDVEPESERAVLSPLDQQIGFAIVDAASRTTGCFSSGEIDAMVDELVRLNGRRHQSFYHVGFRDVMFDRRVADRLPAESSARWAWYFAGYVDGLERRKEADRILELYDRYAHVRKLGSSGPGLCEVAGVHVFQVLCQRGRHAEAASFISDNAAYYSDRAVTVLLEEGTRLLRQELPQVAEPMFNTLWQALARRKAELKPVADERWNDVRRRRAHCLRLRDNGEAARPLLEEVLKDSDDNGRAVVLIDLALLDAGFRRLFELHYPVNQGDIGHIVERLLGAEPRIRKAMEFDVPATSHARYVWGFVLLLQRRYEEALEHLDTAVTAFEARPEVYSGGNLLVRARLHLAIAVCHVAADVVRLPRVGGWITDAIAKGEILPDYLIGDVVGALALADPRSATGAAEQILAAAGPMVLDALVGSPAAERSPAIVEMLVARARSGVGGVGRAAKDWLTALPLLLVQQRHAEAAEALDALEVQAHEGIGTEKFLELLQDSDRFSPAWEVEDARWAAISCFESCGRYGDAARLLSDELHRVLGTDRPSRLDDAVAVIERLLGYGEIGSAAAEPLQRRLDALLAQDGAEPECDEALSPVKVLVIGGNEVQRRYDEAVEAELRESFPQVRVSFMHTGWTSNWGVQLDDVKRRLPSVDGVVMMRLMRTELGRQVRAGLGSIPWRACTGRGKASIRASVVAAAREVWGNRARARLAGRST